MQTVGRLLLRAGLTLSCAALLRCAPAPELPTPRRRWPVEGRDWCPAGRCHSTVDLGSYDAYLGGRLQDYEHPAEAIAAAMASMPQM